MNANFECDICHVVFPTEECVVRHKKTHANQGHDKKHTCPYCPYSAMHPSKLKRHFLTHTGEKPHRCPECDRRFALKATLESHLLVHTGEKPFQCRACGSWFNRASNLRRHQRTHSGSRPYACPTCGEQFGQMGHLRRHERRRHKRLDTGGVSEARATKSLVALSEAHDKRKAREEICDVTRGGLIVLMQFWS